MNIILLHAHELDWQQESNSPNNTATAELQGRRFLHIQSVHKANMGDELRVGVIDGEIGTGRVIGIDENSIRLQVCLQQQPPPRLPVTLILALPRPKMLKRILQSATSMGVEKIILVNSYKVEKSFWQSPVLEAENVQQQLILGLEQSIDTQLPEVSIKKRFKPFVEDELPALTQNKRCIVAHPNQQAAPCIASNQETLLAIGPEGGFIPYEVEQFNHAGFETVTLGRRILRVETAIPVLLSKLFL